MLNFFFSTTRSAAHTIKSAKSLFFHKATSKHSSFTVNRSPSYSPILTRSWAPATENIKITETPPRTRVASLTGSKKLSRAHLPLPPHHLWNHLLLALQLQVLKLYKDGTVFCYVNPVILNFQKVNTENPSTTTPSKPKLSLYSFLTHQICYSTPKHVWLKEVHQHEEFSCRKSRPAIALLLIDDNSLVLSSKNQRLRRWLVWMELELMWLLAMVGWVVLVLLVLVEEWRYVLWGWYVAWDAYGRRYWWG